MIDSTILDKEEARRAHVISVAFDVVTRYGFKRTTMDDLAKAAGMSRPALYLLYKNKTDVYRACIEDFIKVTQGHASACFDTNDSPAEQATNALIVGIILPMRKILDTPHGVELLEMKEIVAGDLAHQWIRMLETELENGLTKALASGKIVLPNETVSTAQIAGFMADAVEGIKHRMSDLDAMEKRLKDLVTLMIAPLVR